MADTDEFGTKLTVLHLNGRSLTFTKVAPADSDELRELKELARMGLAKYLVIDTSASFIAHKDIERKLIDDLTRSNNVIAEIVDRSRQERALVQIHASNVWLRKSSLTPSQFEKRIQKENSLLENYTKSR
jgi:hypothetical protein